MDQISASLDAAIADARKAAVPGAIGDAPDRVGSIITSPIASLANHTSTSASPLSVAIDGPGLFAFDDHGNRCFGRLGEFKVDADGTLIDSRGRAVLGIENGASIDRGQIARIRIAPGTRVTDVAIDELGSLSGVVNGLRTSIAHIVLATFPASERLERVDATAARATPASGPPHYRLPGAPNVGALRPHALEIGLVDLQGDLARMWRLQGQRDVATAQVFAADECSRAALGLVK